MEGVVPVAVEVMAGDGQGGDLVVAEADAGEAFAGRGREEPGPARQPRRAGCRRTPMRRPRADLGGSDGGAPYRPASRSLTGAPRRRPSAAHWQPPSCRVRILRRHQFLVHREQPLLDGRQRPEGNDTASRLRPRSACPTARRRPAPPAGHAASLTCSRGSPYPRSSAGPRPTTPPSPSGAPPAWPATPPACPSSDRTGPASPVPLSPGFAVSSLPATARRTALSTGPTISGAATSPA